MPTPAVKPFALVSPENAGEDVHMMVRSLVPGHDEWLDGDGEFSADPGDAAGAAMTEDLATPGVFVRKEGRAAWLDGPYLVTFWKQSGAEPDPVVDILVDSVTVQLFRDQIVGVT